jgi:hypothetical protein
MKPQLSDLAPIAGIHMPLILAQEQSTLETLPSIPLVKEESGMDSHTRLFSEITMVL